MEMAALKFRVKALINGLYRSEALQRLAAIDEWIGKITVFFGIISYLTASGDRAKQRHYQAWQVLNLARDTASDNGRSAAIGDLASDGVNLRGLTIAGLSLYDRDLRGASMPDAIWSHVFISALDFSCKRSVRQFWFRCTPSNLFGLHVTFSGIVFSSFRDAALDRAIFVGTDEMPTRYFGLLRDDFRGASMEGVDFQTTVINDTKFDKALMKRANFQSVRFDGMVSFRGAYLSQAFFNLISFSQDADIDLTDADLSGAIFDFRELMPSDFPRATLCRSRFTSGEVSRDCPKGPRLPRGG